MVLTTMLVDHITAVGKIFLCQSILCETHGDLELANLHIVTKHAPNTPILPEDGMILEQANGKILLFHVDGPIGKNMVRRLEALQKAFFVQKIPSKDSPGSQAPNRNLRATS